MRFLLIALATILQTGILNAGIAPGVAKIEGTQQLVVGESALLQFDGILGIVSVISANEEICTATKIATKQFTVTGVAIGQTQVYAEVEIAGGDNETRQLNVVVCRTQDFLNRLEDEIDCTFPDSNVRLKLLPNCKVDVCGTVCHPDDLHAIIDFLIRPNLPLEDLVNNLVLEKKPIIPHPPHHLDGPPHPPKHHDLPPKKPHPPKHHRKPPHLPGPPKHLPHPPHDGPAPKKQRKSARNKPHLPPRDIPAYELWQTKQSQRSHVTMRPVFHDEFYVDDEIVLYKEIPHLSVWHEFHPCCDDWYFSY